MEDTEAEWAANIERRDDSWRVFWCSKMCTMLDTKGRSSRYARALRMKQACLKMVGLSVFWRDSGANVLKVSAASCKQVANIKGRSLWPNEANTSAITNN